MSSVPDLCAKILCCRYVLYIHFMSDDSAQFEVFVSSSAPLIPAGDHLLLQSCRFRGEIAAKAQAVGFLD